MKAIAKPTDHLPKVVFGKTLICISRQADAWRRCAPTTLAITKTKKARITTATAISTGFIAGKVPPLNRISEPIIGSIVPPAVSNAKG